MSNQTQQSQAPAINEQQFVIFLSNIKFGKTISSTYQSLGADLSSGDVRAKSIFKRLSTVCDVSEAMSYKGDKFSYIKYDIAFEYDGMPVVGIISTERSVHLMLEQNVTF